MLKNIFKPHSGFNLYGKVLLFSMLFSCNSPEKPVWKSTFYEADFDGQLWVANNYLETSDSIILHLETSKPLGEDMLHCVWYDANGTVQDSVSHKPRSYETEWWLNFKPGDERPLGTWEIKVYRENKPVHKARFIMAFDPIQMGFFTLDEDTVPVELIRKNSGVIRYNARLRRGRKGDKTAIRLHYIEADNEIDAENEGLIMSIDYTLTENMEAVFFDLMPASDLNSGRYAVEFLWFGESIGWSIFRIVNN
jgi:hypothetical protein